MGFYFELKRTASQVDEFVETSVPTSYWGLYAIAGFALTCMGLAAYWVLFDLAKVGSVWDRLMLGLIVMSVPFYLLVGLKLAALKKHVRIGERALFLSWYLGKMKLWETGVPFSDIEEVDLRNERPTSNLAVRQHGDTQYHIRGHWRIVLKLRSGKTKWIDRHTERGALAPLYESIQKRLA